MKKITLILSVMIVMIGFLNSGTIRKKQDPILKTQTDPITYKQKMEEMKDGPKGPPTPSFQLFPKENFMADSSVEEGKEELPQNASTPENISEVPVSEGEESEEWWGDEKKEDSPASAKASNNEEETEEL